MPRMTFTPDQIAAACLNGGADYDEVVHEHYSGRGMMNYSTMRHDTCLGLTGTLGTVTRVIGELLLISDSSLEDSGSALLDYLEEVMDSASSDSMGLGTIYYWRGISVSK